MNTRDDSPTHLTPRASRFASDSSRLSTRLTSHASRLTPQGWLACIPLIALWLVMGCTKPPHEEIQAAETKVREAETAGAPIYVPEEYTVLVAKLEAAKDEIEAQYKISEFSRDYSRANNLLRDTRSKGDQLIAEAQKRREEAKAAALRETAQAKEAVHGVRELVEKVGQSSPSPTGVPEELVAEANELSRTLAEVQTAIEANNHLVAKTKAKAVQEKSQKLKSEVVERAPKARP